MSNWIRFEFNGLSVSGKTKRWLVISTTGPGAVLGTIAWHSSWRRYALYPEGNTVFEKICLRDIADFCDAQTSSHLEKARVGKREGSLI